MDNVFNLDLPLVSVIIPAYNAERFIERTLNSVLSQTYKNIEVLVVDDGSHDRTAEIVKSIASQDQRVILLQQPNSGAVVARNLAIQKSKGEFIAPIDADDIWYPQNIEKKVRCMLKSEPLVGLVYAWSVDIDEEDLPTGGMRVSNIEGEVYTTLVCHHFIGNGSATLIRRNCLEKVGGYKRPEQMAQGSEEWDLYLRIGEYYQFRVVPEFLIGYRKLSNSVSHNCSAIANYHNLLLQDIQKRHPEIPTIIYQWSRSSLYMYLARQSSRTGQHKNTLLWLYKALRSEFITPFLRIGLYVLAIQSILKIIAHPVTSLVWLDQEAWVKLKSRFRVETRTITMADLNKQSLAIQLRLFAENLLHQVISKILTKPVLANKKMCEKYEPTN